MEPPGGRDTRFNLGYNMNLLSGGGGGGGGGSEGSPDVYGNPSLGRPGTSLQQLSPRHHTMVSGGCNRGALKSDIYDDRGLSGAGMGLDGCVGDINDDAYSMQSKKSPPSNGKKTKGRVKIKMEYIENKLRRYTTFSKRKTGIMKKAYELSTLTGTQVMLLVASETGHVYTFATRKLQPMITSEAGKALIQTCLNSPDPPAGSAGGDQRMSATGFEETELTYNISDDDSKEDDSGSESSSEEMETGEDSTQQINHNKSPIIKNAPFSTTPSISSSTTTPSTPPASIIPSTRLLASTSSRTPSSGAAASSSSSSTSLSSSAATSGSSGQVQALPIVLQTSAGIGYATTTDGSILGLLQGPNIVQPQFVAIPISNVTAQKTDDVVNKTVDDKTS